MLDRRRSLFSEIALGCATTRKTHSSKCARSACGLGKTLWQVEQIPATLIMGDCVDDVDDFLLFEEP